MASFSRGWLGGRPSAQGLRMKRLRMKRYWLVLAAGLAITVAGVAVADNLSSAKQADFFAPGKHRFYVWCAKDGNYSAIEAGSSAEDAQIRLYKDTKAKGHAACWPVWQGKLSG